MNIHNALIVTALFAVPAVATAQHAHFDVSPYLSGGQIVTDGITHESAINPFTGETATARNYIARNMRVFEYEIGEDPSFPFEVDDPGINRAPGTYWNAEGEPLLIGGTGLPLSSTLSITILQDLLYWSGTGFGAVPTGETITLYRSGTTYRTIGTGTGEQSPMLLQTFNINDNVHLHLTAEINETAAEGVYLIAARFDSSSSSVLSSEPFYLVYGYHADEEAHEAAIDWVQANYVPEPSSLSLLAVGGLLTLRRRR